MHRTSSTETAQLMVRKGDPPPVRQALRRGRPIGPGNGDLPASLSDRSRSPQTERLGEAEHRATGEEQHQRMNERPAQDQRRRNDCCEPNGGSAK
jgi:hypothetical protein